MNRSTGIPLAIITATEIRLSEVDSPQTMDARIITRKMTSSIDVYQLPQTPIVVQNQVPSWGIRAEDISMQDVLQQQLSNLLIVYPLIGI